MKVKYIRWSTLQQTGARQLMDKQDYDLILQEQISGSVKLADRPKGKELLQLIQAGKVTDLFIEEITRLGRNAADAMATLELCREYNVNVIVLNMGLSSIVNGKPNQVFGIITALLTAMAQHEKEAIKERTEAGKVAARMRGVKFGRPEGSNERDNEFLAKEDSKKIAKLLKDEKYSLRQIAAISDTSLATVQKVKKVLSKKAK